MLPVLDGYISYQTKRNCSQNSGIVIYIKPNLTHSVTEPLISEANRLVCSLPSNDMVIIVVYRSPSFHKVNEFLSSLYVILTKFSNISNTLTVDINIHINTINSDSDAHEYLTLACIRRTCCLPAKLTLVLDTSITDHLP